MESAQSEIGLKRVDVLTLPEEVLSSLRVRHIVQIENLLELSRNDLKNRGFSAGEIDLIVTALSHLGLCLKCASC